MTNTIRPDAPTSGPPELGFDPDAAPNVRQLASAVFEPTDRRPVEPEVAPLTGELLDRIEALVGSASLPEAWAPLPPDPTHASAERCARSLIEAANSLATLPADDTRVERMRRVVDEHVALVAEVAQRTRDRL